MINEPELQLNKYLLSSVIVIMGPEVLKLIKYACSMYINKRRKYVKK